MGRVKCLGVVWLPSKPLWKVCLMRQAGLFTCHICCRMTHLDTHTLYSSVPHLHWYVCICYPWFFPWIFLGILLNSLAVNFFFVLSWQLIPLVYYSSFFSFPSQMERAEGERVKNDRASSSFWVAYVQAVCCQQIKTTVRNANVMLNLHTHTQNTPYTVNNIWTYNEASLSAIHYQLVAVVKICCFL